MLTLNNKKFAANEKEFLDSLFESSGSCVGYYKVNKRSISLLDHQKNKIGVIANGVLGKADKINGKWWYSYGDIPQIGRYESYMQQCNEIDSAMSLLN